MSAPGQDQPVPPGGVMAQDPAAVTNALLIAIKRAAEAGAAGQDTREIGEAGKAALAFAQALVVLDPGLDGQGVPLGHHEALAQARQAAAAPTPARRGQADTQ